jgi:hypothetical protein
LSNEIGKGRLRQLWKRQKEEQQEKARIVVKRETKEELHNRITELLRKQGPCSLSAIADSLHLDIMQKIKLQALVEELESNGKLTRRTVDEATVYEVA